MPFPNLVPKNVCEWLRETGIVVRTEHIASLTLNWDHIIHHSSNEETMCGMVKANHPFLISADGQFH